VEAIINSGQKTQPATHLDVVRIPDASSVFPSGTMFPNCLNCNLSNRRRIFCTLKHPQLVVCVSRRSAPVSGWMVRSLLATMYQLGFDLQAVPSTFC